MEDASQNTQRYDFDYDGFITEVIPRVYRVRLPLPDNPLREPNSYFILLD